MKTSKKSNIIHKIGQFDPWSRISKVHIICRKKFNMFHEFHYLNPWSRGRNVEKVSIYSKNVPLFSSLIKKPKGPKFHIPIHRFDPWSRSPVVERPKQIQYIIFDKMNNFYLIKWLKGTKVENFQYIPLNARGIYWNFWTFQPFNLSIKGQNGRFYGIYLSFFDLSTP